MSGKFLQCNDCAATWCRHCIERTANDIGSEDGDFTGWRCFECQAAWDGQRHVSEDVQLDDDKRIAEEIMNVAIVCGFVPGVVSELPDDRRGGGGGGGGGGEEGGGGGDAYDSMYIPALKELLGSRELVKTGKKAELIDRLRVDDTKRAQTVAAAAAGGGGCWCWEHRCW
jgi:hypothetical protein